MEIVEARHTNMAIDKLFGTSKFHDIFHRRPPTVGSNTLSYFFCPKKRRVLVCLLNFCLLCWAIHDCTKSHGRTLFLMIELAEQRRIREMLVLTE